MGTVIDLKLLDHASEAQALVPRATYTIGPPEVSFRISMLG